MSEVAQTPTASDRSVEGGALLEVQDLHVRFASRTGLFSKKDASPARAVDGVDLSIGRGEILALAGESGCGKTTLARSIMGFTTPDKGRILFEGEPLGKRLKEYRRRVQMVYQDPTGSLNPRQTVYDAVAEGLRIHNVARRSGGRTRRPGVVAGRPSPAGRFFLRFPHELSGGQRQRVVIAGALALEPRLIVADEPVSNLDASIRGQILKLLPKLREEDGISVIIVTHDLGLAWTVADRVAVMYLGRIVELGPTKTVLTDPLHPYTKALLGVVPEGGGSGRPLLVGEPPDPGRSRADVGSIPGVPRWPAGRQQRPVSNDRASNSTLACSAGPPTSTTSRPVTWPTSRTAR